MEWHDRLKVVLKRSGISQAKLARQSGVPYGNIRGYTRGIVAQPRGEQLASICRVLGVDVIWLLYGEERAPPPPPLPVQATSTAEAILALSRSISELARAIGENKNRM